MVTILRTCPQCCFTGAGVLVSCSPWCRSLRCVPVCSSVVWTRLWTAASSPAGTSRSSSMPAGWRTCPTLSSTACRSLTSPSRISLTPPSDTTLTRWLSGLTGTEQGGFWSTAAQAGADHRLWSWPTWWGKAAPSPAGSAEVTGVVLLQVKYFCFVMKYLHTVVQDLMTRHSAGLFAGLKASASAELMKWFWSSGLSFGPTLVSGGSWWTTRGPCSAGPQWGWWGRPAGSCLKPWKTLLQCTVSTSEGQTDVMDSGGPDSAVDAENQVGQLNLQRSFRLKAQRI